MNKNLPILIVEDDKGVSFLITEKIKEIYDFTVQCYTGSEALTWLENNSAEIITLDFSLPDMNAIEFITKLKNKKIEVPPFIVATGYGDEKIAVELMKLGARDYFVKESNFIESIPKIIENLLKSIKLENELKESKKLLEEKQRLLEQAQKIAHLGSWLYDFNNDSIYWSQEMYNIFDLTFGEELNYKKTLNFIYEEDRQNVEIARKTAIEKKTDINIEYRIVTKKNEIKYVHERGEFNKDSETISLSGTLLDITEYTKIKQQLIHSEKLSVVGQLSAGIAHEFNNILAILKTNVQYLQSLSQQNDETSEFYNIFIDQIDRAAVIIKQLMIFAKPKESKKTMVSINFLIDEVLKLQSKQLNFENIKVIKNYSDETFVLGDSGQLQQVLINLIINASHAIMPKEKGEIKIITENKSNNVVIKIIDSGIGIEKNIHDKVFTPFFSTKGAYASNRHKINGTGLGLAVSQKIIENHNGRIFFDSQPGIGTEFTIILPSAVSERIYDDYKKPDINFENINKKNSFILFVDDEHEIINIIKKILKKYGYTNVATVNEGIKAIELSKKSKFDIIFMDIMMPDINGYKAVQEIRKHDSTAVIFFTSGKIDIEKSNLHDLNIKGVIQKPFDFNEIIDAIEKS
ncbi:response regulator [Candidatus Dependentiae bacterium]|nr:response regulator [Candidatus Dependentiae bacterium]